MNATELIADVKLKCQLSSDQSTISDSNILSLATNELRTVIAPKITSVREGYFDTYKDYTLSSTRSYRLPHDAIGNHISDVAVRDANGNERDIDLVDPFEHSNFEGYYIRNNHLVLNSISPETGTLRVYYCIRPAALTETCFLAVIVNSTTIQTNAVSTNIATAHGYTANDLVSIQFATSPYEFGLFDATVLTVPTSSTFTIASTSSLGSAGDILVVTLSQDYGDYVNNKLSFFPQIPLELHDWLSYRTAIRVMEHLGMNDQANAKKEKLGDIEKDVLALISPRVSNEPKTIVGGETLGWKDY